MYQIYVTDDTDDRIRIDGVYTYKTLRAARAILPRVCAWFPGCRVWLEIGDDA